MTLSAGARLGPYEVLAPIGAGGMGEVYRARDTRLSREVALKVLPEELARDRTASHLPGDPVVLTRDQLNHAGAVSCRTESRSSSRPENRRGAGAFTFSRFQAAKLGRFPARKFCQQGRSRRTGGSSPAGAPRTGSSSFRPPPEIRWPSRVSSRRSGRSSGPPTGSLFTLSKGRAPDEGLSSRTSPRGNERSGGSSLPRTPQASSRSRGSR